MFCILATGLPALRVKASTATLTSTFALIGLSSSVEYTVMELEKELENVKTLKTKLGIVLFF